MTKSTVRLIILVTFLLPSCTSSVSTPITQQATQIGIRPDPIEPTNESTSTPTVALPSPSAAPWTILSEIPSLPTSQLFYSTFHGFFVINIDCSSPNTSCLSEPITFLEGPTERFTMTISPDGNFLATAFIQAYGGNLGFQSSIRIVSIDDGRSWRIAPMGSKSPVWSRDGGRIAYIDYLVDDGKRNRICLSTTEEPYRCLPASGNFMEIDHVVWSPNGQFLAYCVHRLGDPCDLRVYDLDTYQESHIAGDASSPAWFGQGSLLLYSKCASEICSFYVVDLAECLTEEPSCWEGIEPADKLQISEPLRGLQLSPDDKYVSLVSDGRLAVFKSNCLQDGTSCSESFHYLSAPELIVWGHSWSPENAHIAYVGTKGPIIDLYIVEVEGNGSMYVVPLDYHAAIDWRPP